jgi:hypothetical protein
MADAYNPAKFDLALEKIMNGEVPSEFCNEWDPNMPDFASSIELWAQADPVLAARLTEAKRIGAQVMIASCITIAKDRSFRPDERKLMIDTRKYLASLWSADCNPKTVIEQTTTVRNLTPKQEYIDQCVSMLGMDPATAGARYDKEQGATVQ